MFLDQLVITGNISLLCKRKCSKCFINKDSYRYLMGTRASFEMLNKLMVDCRKITWSCNKIDTQGFFLFWFCFGFFLPTSSFSADLEIRVEKRQNEQKKWGLSHPDMNI